MRLTILSLMTLTACSGISEFTEPHDTADFVPDTDTEGDTDPSDTAVDTDRDTDPIDTDTAADTDPTDTDPVDTAVDTDPTDTGPVDTEPVDTGVDTEPVDTGVDTEPVDTGVDTEPVDTGVDIEPVDTGVDTEPVDTDVDPDPLDTSIDTDPDTAVDTAPADTDTGVELPVDVDADGFTAADGDCDDANATVFPGADERCNAIDDDCDGVIDPDTAIDALTVYLDADADGFGDVEAFWFACEVGANETVNPGDCDDADPAYNPGALEEDCTDPADYNCDGSTGYADADGDGYAACAECDDTNADAFPGAEEICNGQDDDCDGTLDEGAFDASLWFADLDADGFGDASFATLACDAPLGASPLDSDCDDTSALVFPDAPESCNGVDDDCDGALDEAAIDASYWYADDDGDGFGDSAVTALGCEAPSGYVPDAADCDDGDAEISPDGVETCNTVDDDCDGTVDSDATDAVLWYADADRDGYGDAADVVTACSAPRGRVANADDCDDGDTVVHPGALEFCNGIDDDCDGAVDPGDAGGATEWYADADADGFGDADAAISACEPPTGFVADASDCDDAAATTFPGADEACNAVDDDCDGVVDPESAIDAALVYADADGDGFGDDTLAAYACAPEPGWSAARGDCDDADAAYNPAAVEDDCTDPADYNCDGSVGYVDDDGDGFAACEECDDQDAAHFPGANELCNGADDDCDGTVDQGALDAGTWYADADDDGFGDAADTTVACDAPEGYTADAADCDDADAAVSPDGIEVCNAVDDDCDGAVDPTTAADADTWYADADGDGFGDASRPAQGCEAPAGYVANADDCDDANAAISPDGVEACNGADDDCDGTVDQGALDAGAWYADADGDGFGDAADTTLACDAPSGFVALATDCADDDAAVYPGATETCDGLDNDCDGATDEGDATDAPTWWADVDGDGFGGTEFSLASCTAPNHFLADSSDCADRDPSVNPAAAERCNAVDDDCDGTVDPDTSVDAATWYADADGDGAGDAGNTTLACEVPSGFVLLPDDCDDTDAGALPGAVEVCDDKDNDCDGAVDAEATDAASWYPDFDGDGYGDPTQVETACDAPPGYLADGTDCDGADNAVHPGAEEWCNTTDDDCDGVVDESAMDPDTYYLDLDGDGVGEEGVTADACAQPDGFAASYGDCDDEDATVYPGAEELCDDGLDQDCSGTADDDGACYGCVEVDGYLLCEPETRALAADTCALLGSQLVTVDDEVENEALVEAMLSQNVFVSWIGLNDLVAEGDYLWADATPATWTNWSSGDPNDPDGDDDCVVMVPDGTWVDVTCSYGFSYICE